MPIVFTVMLLWDEVFAETLVGSRFRGLYISGAALRHELELRIMGGGVQMLVSVVIL